ncbi:MAG: hypothetical protein AMXMBFR53_30020 [Gemmatimonadota bacterium]
MGTGPNGSGVTITPASQVQRETRQERDLRLRREYAERMQSHYAAQDAFAAQGGASDVALKKAAPHENKALAGPPENKGPANPPGGETADDLMALSKRALQALAEDRRVTVTRADGRTDREPTKDDYVRALAP